MSDRPEETASAEPPDASSPEQLAWLLKQARELLGLSVRRAAAEVGISSTYLSQLEAGAIKEPSPRVLHSLARVYKLSYAELMRRAGYVVPSAAGDAASHAAASPLDVALRTTTPLTENERAALAEYLAWYRSRHGRPPETR
jgi:transcriptional regulator with XRE-family HTH domain